MTTEGRAFVHVGLPKTGSSYLQTLLFASPGELDGMGVRMLPGSELASFELHRALARLPRNGRGDAPRLQALERDARRSRQDRVVVSNERLASVSRGQAAHLLRRLEPREVHLVVTVRDIARRLPSAWQQRVKGQMDLGYEAFLSQVVEGRGKGRVLLRHHDGASVLRRWAATLPPERVHVVTIPVDSQDRSVLPRRFGEVIGVDFEQLDRSRLRANESMDFVQTELVRRLNRLTDFPSHRQSLWARRYVASELMAPRKGETLRTPEALEPWCQEMTERFVSLVRKRGFRVHGDLDELWPQPGDFAPPPADPTAEDLLDVALPTMAQLLMKAGEQADLIRELRRRQPRARLRRAVDRVRRNEAPGAL